jgi:mannose-6-phosphate isomerase class I
VPGGASKNTLTMKSRLIVLGVSESGIIAVDREELSLSAGILVFIPKGARRSTVSASEDFAYLTVYRRRGPL